MPGAWGFRPVVGSLAFDLRHAHIVARGGLEVLLGQRNAVVLLDQRLLQGLGQFVSPLGFNRLGGVILILKTEALFRQDFGKTLLRFVKKSLCLLDVFVEDNNLLDATVLASILEDCDNGGICDILAVLVHGYSPRLDIRGL